MTQVKHNAKRENVSKGEFLKTLGKKTAAGLNNSQEVVFTLQL